MKNGARVAITERVLEPETLKRRELFRGSHCLSASAWVYRRLRIGNATSEGRRDYFREMCMRIP